MAVSPSLLEATFEVDKLSSEIFSILENKFLFGYYDPKLLLAGSSPETPPKTPARPAESPGNVCILSIDAGSDGLFAAASLVRLESSLRRLSGDPAARIADFFDVVSGSGSGGVLASLLFTRGPDGFPLYSAEDALCFLAKRGSECDSTAGRKGLFSRLFSRSSGGIFRRIFGESTLRDTVKPLLIPCYDLTTGAPFLFSRADAVEADAYDFPIREVCAATCAEGGTVKMTSVDGRTRIAAVGGGLAMASPAAAAITHVLHNKQEFPFAVDFEDLLVVSIGAGGPDVSGGCASPSTAEVVRIAGIGMADMVDQAIAMAFGQNRENNYIRIQANWVGPGNAKGSKAKSRDAKKMMEMTEEMLVQRNGESVLFQGKRLSKESNTEKLERLAGDLIREQDRRRKSPIPTVVIKQTMTPRTSSATTTTVTTSTGRSFGSP